MTTPCELVQIEYQGNGTLSVFAFPFPYDFKTEVKVALWNNTTKKHEDILTTDATYPWEVNDANPTAVTFTGTVPPSPPTPDVNEDPIYNVRIYRTTDMTDIRSVFNQGSAIRATDLNKNFEQLRYAIQEGKCQIPDKLLEYLDEYYWNNYSDVVYSNETWVSNDQTIATTASLDQRFQDEADETLISSETWVADDDHIATTQSLENRFDTLIETDILVDATGLTKSATGGQTTIGIGSNSVDLDRIKTADIVQTADYSTTWTGVNDKVATVGALEARHDVVVSTTQPTTAQVGKQWLDITPGNQKHQIYDGSGWRTVAVGQPFSPATATIVRYVDATNGSDAVDVTGFLPQAPLQSIKRAVDLINSDSSDGSLVVVAPGVYQETLPIQIQRNNVSIVGQALRSCFVQPTQATETNTMFECNSGTLLANMTFVGLKASGTRGNSTYDSDATYGLPENQGWACAFYAGATIKKSPYIQNCTNFTDSSIDNSVKYDQTNLPAGGLGGDTNSAMSGGGILCDGSVPASSSPLRSFVVDSFTQVALDGPGILCTNNGYAQLVSFFGTFCHYHAKALNGGQLNLSNCTTDFGRYGLIADGRSTSAQITGSSVGTAAAAATSVVVDGLAAQGGFFSNQPGSTMIMEVGGNDYQILDASQVSGNQCTINIYRATNIDPNTNLGLVAQINNNTSVSFKLRSYISTGGHTFEYCGAGTDYSAHPDYGGQAVEANQVVELGGTGSADAQIYNRGKVWQSSTDENGLFKVGDKFKVDQRRGTITLDGFTVAAEVVSDTTPQLGGDLDLNSNDITGTGNVNITGTVTATSFTGAVDVVSDTTPQLGGSLDVNGNSIVSVSNGNITLAPNGTGEVDIDSTTAIIVPVGTEAQRPTTPEAGMIRFNSDTDKYESYDGTNWGSLVGGDIGTAPENIPINQYLGKQAFVDEVGTLRPYFPTGSFYSAPQTGGDIQFRYVSDTSIQIVMKGLRRHHPFNHIDVKLMSNYPTVRPSLTLDFQKSKQLDPRISFSRSSSATYVEGGVIKYADEHQARFEDEGLLMEESKTNAVLYSEHFQNQWSVGGGGSGGSATNSQTVSPDGNNTGAKFAAPATRYLTGTTTESGMPNTAVRFNLAAGTFDSIITGSPDSYDIAPAGNGWYRCKLTVSNLTCSIYAKKGELDFIGIQLLNSSFYLYALNSTYNQTSTTDGIYVWGAQLETGSLPTSYIPTSGSTVTRSTDVARITGDNFSSWYNTSESTWYAEGDQVGIDSDGNQVGRQSIFVDRYANISPQRWLANKWRGKQNLAARIPTYTTPVTPKGSTVKTIYAVDGTNGKMCVGGVLSSTGTLTTYPQTTELRLGKSDRLLVNDDWRGHISRLSYYSERLTDTQLQAITS